MGNGNNKNIWKLLIGIVLLLAGLVLCWCLYVPNYDAYCINCVKSLAYWMPIAVILIGATLIYKYSYIKKCSSKSMCQEPKRTRVQLYIDNITILKREYICTRNKQFIIAIILFLAILSSVLIPYIRNLYKIGFIFSSDFHKSHLNELKTFNIIDMMRQDKLSLFWDSIPLFIIFIILCILLFYIILCIRITSHKISLINSTITKVALYKNNEHYDNNDTPIFSIQSVDDNDLRYYWAIDGKWLTDERGDKIPNQTNGVVTIFKIECGYFKFSTDGGQNWHKANAFEYERNMANIEKRIQLEINRLTQELNADSSRDIWRAIFNSH